MLAPLPKTKPPPKTGGAGTGFTTCTPTSTVDVAVQVVNPVPAPPVLGGGFVYGNGANTPVASANPPQGIVNDDQGKPK